MIAFSSDKESVLAAIQQLVNLFLLNGFAFEGRASIVADHQEFSGATGAQYKLDLVAPATIWGARALEQEGAKVTNSFVFKAVTELVHRAGYEILSSSIKYEGSTEEIVFAIG